MKGLIIKSVISGKNGTLKIGIPNGIATVSVTIMYNNKVTWGAGAMTMPEGRIISWDGGQIGVGDSICLKFTDINVSDPPMSKEQLNACIENASKADDSDEWQFRLQSYHKLKAYLEEIHAI